MVTLITFGAGRYIVIEGLKKSFFYNPKKLWMNTTDHCAELCFIFLRNITNKMVIYDIDFSDDIIFMLLRSKSVIFMSVLIHYSVFMYVLHEKFFL